MFNFLSSLPFISTAITLLFALAVLVRYAQRRGTHLLLWSFGLLLYGLGTFSEAYLHLAFNEWVLRLWYLTGAMLTAAWLGQGTVHLLIRKPGVAALSSVLLLVVSIFAAVGIVAIPVTGIGFDAHLPISTQYKTLMARDAVTIALTVLLNIYGSLGLIGGAAWSAYLFARKRILSNRMWGNVLIAVGALMPASAGTMIKLDLGDWLYLSELLGAAIMYAGFLLATAHQPQSARQSAQATA